MPRRKTTAAPDPDAPTFEEALAGLEAIVEAMENEQLPLEELVAQYEKGSKLLDRCETVLQSARERIELITLRDRGAPADDDESAAEQPGDRLREAAPVDANDDDDDDDIRLF